MDIPFKSKLQKKKCLISSKPDDNYTLLKNQTIRCHRLRSQDNFFRLGQCKSFFTHKFIQS